MTLFVGKCRFSKVLKRGIHETETKKRDCKSSGEFGLFDFENEIERYILQDVRV